MPFFHITVTYVYVPEMFTPPLKKTDANSRVGEGFWETDTDHL